MKELSNIVRFKQTVTRTDEKQSLRNAAETFG